MNQRNLPLILIASLVLHTTGRAMEGTVQRNVKILTWLAAAVGTQQVARPAIDSPFDLALQQKCGLSIGDITNTATLSASLYAISYLFNNNRRKKIQWFATRFPIGSCIGKLITSASIKQSTKNIPVINWYLACHNNQCTGSCQYCSLKSMLLCAGVMKMIM